MKYISMKKARFLLACYAAVNLELAQKLVDKLKEVMSKESYGEGRQFYTCHHFYSRNSNGIVSMTEEDEEVLLFFLRTFALVPTKLRSEGYKNNPSVWRNDKKRIESKETDEVTMPAWWDTISEQRHQYWELLIEAFEYSIENERRIVA